MMCYAYLSQTLPAHLAGRVNTAISSPGARYSRISTGGMLDETIAMFERDGLVEVHRVRNIVDDLIIRPLRTVDECARILCHAGRVAPIDQPTIIELAFLDSDQFAM
jgi:hypothetical protein